MPGKFAFFSLSRNAFIELEALKPSVGAPKHTRSNSFSHAASIISLAFMRVVSRLVTLPSGI